MSVILHIAVPKRQQNLRGLLIAVVMDYKADPEQLQDWGTAFGRTPRHAYEAWTLVRPYETL